MYKINEYWYDPERLIFFKDDLSPEDLEVIQTEIRDNSDYNVLRRKLDCYDPNNVQLQPGELAGAGICLTKNCNLRCNYCCDSSSEGKEEHLCIKDIEVFIKDLVKRWAIHHLIVDDDVPLLIYFTGGGEPTYKWELLTESIHLIEEICEVNDIPYSLGITTNGVLNREQLEFISKYFDTIMISYDGLPEIQNKNRISPHLDETASIVSESIKYLSKRNPHVTVRTTIWQDNLYLLREMANHIFSEFPDIQEWSVLPVTPTGRALKKVFKEQDLLNRCDFLDYYIGAKEFVEQKFKVDKITTALFPNSLTKYFCSALTFSCKCPWLLQDGKIITCMEPCDFKTVIGEIKDHKLIYYKSCSDPLLGAYQKKFMECKDCIAYRFCKGGCPAKQLMNNGIQTSMDDWQCNSIRRYWEYLFTRLLSGEGCFGWKLSPIESNKLRKYNILKLVEEKSNPNITNAELKVIKTIRLDNKMIVHLPKTNKIIELNGNTAKIWDIIVHMGRYTSTIESITEAVAREFKDCNLSSCEIQKCVEQLSDLYKSELGDCVP